VPDEKPKKGTVSAQEAKKPPSGPKTGRKPRVLADGVKGPGQPKHAGGRPTKYSEEVAHTIITAILGGNYAYVAAAAAGITEETYYAWLAEKPEFSERVKRAEASAEAGLVVGLRTSEDPRVRLEVLARRYRQRWSRSEQVEVTGPGGGPHVVEYVVVQKPSGGKK
jgi:hypothetical protein